MQDSDNYGQDTVACHLATCDGRAFDLTCDAGLSAPAPEAEFFG